MVLSQNDSFCEFKAVGVDPSVRRHVCTSQEIPTCRNKIVAVTGFNLANTVLAYLSKEGIDYNFLPSN